MRRSMTPKSVQRMGLALMVSVGSSFAGSALANEEALLAEAARIIAEADAGSAEARRAGYAAAEDILQEIVRTFPESDAAISILLEEPISGVDPAAIRAVLSADPETAAADPIADGDPISPCFDVQIDDDASVTFAFSVDESGSVMGRPRLIAPDRPGPAERRLFRRGLDAIEACAPYPGYAGVEALEVTFSTSGVAIAGAPPTGTTAPPAPPPVEAEPSIPQETRQPTVAGDPLPEPTTTARLPEPASAPSSVSPVTQPQVSQPQAAPPPPPDEATETALSLDRNGRREVQRRLQLLGFDPRGVDGIFGPGSRGAIRAWQNSRNLPSSGFLDEQHLIQLRRESAAQYERWRAEAATQRTRTPPAQNRGASGRYIDSRGCLRESDGSYVRGFKAGCG